eukprot:sb/3469837/
MMSPLRGAKCVTIKSTIITMTCYAVFSAILVLIMFIIHLRTSYSIFVVGCIFSGDPDNDNQNEIAYYLLILSIATSLVPVLVVMVCCAISTMILMSSPGMAPTRDKKRRATHTILIFTVSFLILSMPNAAQIIMRTISIITNWRINPLQFDMVNPPYVFYFFNYSSMISVALNATCNPLIYLWRFSEYSNRFHGSRRRVSRVVMNRVLTVSRDTKQSNL